MTVPTFVGTRATTSTAAVIAAGQLALDTVGHTLFRSVADIGLASPALERRLAVEDTATAVVDLAARTLEVDAAERGARPTSLEVIARVAKVVFETAKAVGAEAAGSTSNAAARGRRIW